MDTTLYVALSQQTALQRQLDLVANNIANLNTTGFRRETAMFQKFVSEQADEKISNLRTVDYVTDAGVYRESTQGNVIITGGTYDMALDGKGFFKVRTSSGQIHYTRNGSFNLDQNGQLANASGSVLLDDSNSPIEITDQDLDVRIAADGTVASKRGLLGNIAFYEFANDSQLQKAGNNEYTAPATQPPILSPSTRVTQGKLEASNVNGVLEITDLIKVQRRYESTARMIEDYQKLRSNSINQLSQARSA